MDKILTLFDHPPISHGQVWTFQLTRNYVHCPCGHLWTHPLYQCLLKNLLLSSLENLDILVNWKSNKNCNFLHTRKNTFNHEIVICVSCWVLHKLPIILIFKYLLQHNCHFVLYFFCPHGHARDYLTILLGQSWTFHPPPTHLIMSTWFVNDPFLYHLITFFFKFLLQI